MIEFAVVFLIALFVEAIVNALKPIWSKDCQKLTVAEYVSMALGIVLAVACKINLLAYVVEAVYPVWVAYIFYVMTGIAIGRGTNFLYDLWNRLRKGHGDEATVFEGTEIIELEQEPVDLEITNWPLEQVISFAKLNGFNLPDNMPTDSTEAREYLIDCLFGKRAKEYGNDGLSVAERNNAK